MFKNSPWHNQEANRNPVEEFQGNQTHCIALRQTNVFKFEFHNQEFSLQEEGFSLVDVMYAYIKVIWCHKSIKNISDLDILHNLDLSMSSKPHQFLSLNVVMHMETVLYTQVYLTDPVKCIHLMIYIEVIGSAIGVCQVPWSAICFSWPSFLWPSQGVSNDRGYQNGFHSRLVLYCKQYHLMSV